MTSQLRAGRANAPIELSVSIVTYHPDLGLLRDTLESLRYAAQRANDSGMTLRLNVTLVDNGDDFRNGELATEFGVGAVDDVISGHGNVGYGGGHNLAINRVRSDFHLILNPDVRLDSDSLINAVEFLHAEPSTGLLAPLTHGDDGKVQFLCRRFPRLFDLVVRGFFPARLRKLFDARLSRYELRGETLQSNASGTPFGPPIISGCFMFFRTTALKLVGGFDPKYFLYFEDYDLCLRVGEKTAIAYVPNVSIVHHGGGAARKGWRHIAMFTKSAVRFYRTWGVKL